MPKHLQRKHMSSKVLTAAYSDFMACTQEESDSGKKKFYHQNAVNHPGNRK